MKLSFATILSTLAIFASTEAFAPQPTSFRSASSALNAKYKTMDEILALFPEEIPVLINFYDANTEAAIKVCRNDSMIQTCCSV